jgi:hypothetical protein
MRLLKNNHFGLQTLFLEALFSKNEGQTYENSVIFSKVLSLKFVGSELGSIIQLRSHPANDHKS